MESRRNSRTRRCTSKLEEVHTCRDHCGQRGNRGQSRLLHNLSKKSSANSKSKIRIGRKAVKRGRGKNIREPLNSIWRVSNCSFSGGIENGGEKSLLGRPNGAGNPVSTSQKKIQEKKEYPY